MDFTVEGLGLVEYETAWKLQNVNTDMEYWDGYLLMSFT
jgi:hypothetical protein